MTPAPCRLPRSFFIRGHAYTMETISFAIRFWSKGEMAARFLRHEGYLGAVGAFLKVHPMPSVPEAANETAQRKARSIPSFPALGGTAWHCRQSVATRCPLRHLLRPLPAGCPGCYFFLLKLMIKFADWVTAAKLARSAARANKG